MPLLPSFCQEMSVEKLCSNFAWVYLLQSWLMRLWIFEMIWCFIYSSISYICWVCQFVNWVCRCVLCDVITESEVVATRLYLAMSAVITTLMKRPENNFQLTVSRWKFDRFNVNSLGRIFSILIKVRTQCFREKCQKRFFFLEVLKFQENLLICEFVVVKECDLLLTLLQVITILAFSFKNEWTQIAWINKY